MPLHYKAEIISLIAQEYVILLTSSDRLDWIEHGISVRYVLKLI